MFRSKKGKNRSDADSYGSAEDVLGEIDFSTTDAAQYPRSPREAIEPEVAPQPPSDMSTNRNPFVAVLNGLFSLIVFAIVAGIAAFYFLTVQLDAEGPLANAKSIIIPKGSGVSAIAQRLEREGVVSDANLFIAGTMLAKASNKLQAGEFLFEEQASINTVIDALVDGRAILHKITIPEGLTSEQIVSRLLEDQVLTGDVAAIPDEGTLLPDTYKYTRGTSRQEVLNRMANEHDKVLARVWERRDKDLPLKSPEELVVLASIVEKETGKADERPRVASVFVNRLNKSIRLQSDPTIIYGLVGGKGSLGRPILKSEIEQETPYNTYRIDGLPPTPIANPGVAALEATANPSRTNDIYFVADGTGGHVFATTLDEHNRNVARWRKYLQQVKAESSTNDKAPLEAVVVTPKGIVANGTSAETAPVVEAETAPETTGSASVPPIPVLKPVAKPKS